MTTAEKSELPRYAADREAFSGMDLEPGVTGANGAAENALLSDIDAILSRLDAGIAAESTALDALLARIRSRAA